MARIEAFCNLTPVVAGFEQNHYETKPNVFSLFLHLKTLMNNSEKRLQREIILQLKNHK